MYSLDLPVGFGLFLFVGGAACPVVVSVDRRAMLSSGRGVVFFWRALTGWRGGATMEKCRYPFCILTKNRVSADSGIGVSVFFLDNFV